MDTLDKGMVHIPRETERDGLRCHQSTQNSMKFKTHGLLIAAISHLIFPTTINCGELKLQKEKS